MSTSLRIEELKKKFDENPRRYFAPLANEYRKAGDLQQAIAICQAHLPQQPGHMSGHIVYGQALFEAKQFDQARTVFETALALDPENLIALRYLGDIAFELGDRSGARAWYTRVLETDPRNEEIAALMAAMGEERSATSREVAPEPSAPTTAQTSTAPRSEPARADAAPQGSVAAGEAQAPRAAPADEKPRDAAPSATDAELDRLFSRPADADGRTTSSPGAPPAPEQSSFSPVSELAAASRGAQPPSLEQPAPSLREKASPVERETATPANRDNAPARAFESQHGDKAPPHDPSLAGGASGARESGFVTETMAELYLKQGFHDRALDVYRQLIRQNPADRGLRERMERIERELRGAASGWSVGPGAAGATRPGGRDTATAGPGGPTVRQFLASIGSRGVTGRGPGVVPPPGGGPRTSGELRVPPDRPARSATGSIDALFAGAPPSREDVAAASTLAEAFPAGISSASVDAMGGRPAHPAATELSLDHVFREGGGAVGRGTSTVSYDQFFAQASDGGSHGTGDASPGTTPAAGGDDIEQFNAWLQGLKKR